MAEEPEIVGAVLERALERAQHILTMAKQGKASVVLVSATEEGMLILTSVNADEQSSIKLLAQALAFAAPDADDEITGDEKKPYMVH